MKKLSPFPPPSTSSGLRGEPPLSERREAGKRTGTASSPPRAQSSQARAGTQAALTAPLLCERKQPLSTTSCPGGFSSFPFGAGWPLQPRPCSAQVRKCTEGRIPHRKAEETAVYTRGRPAAIPAARLMVGGGPDRELLPGEGTAVSATALIASPSCALPRSARGWLVFEDLG